MERIPIWAKFKSTKVAPTGNVKVWLKAVHKDGIDLIRLIRVAF